MTLHLYVKSNVNITLKLRNKSSPCERLKSRRVPIEQFVKLSAPVLAANYVNLRTRCDSSNVLFRLWRKRIRWVLVLVMSEILEMEFCFGNGLVQIPGESSKDGCSISQLRLARFLHRGLELAEVMDP